jgi:hypothetical protein
MVQRVVIPPEMDDSARVIHGEGGHPFEELDRGFHVLEMAGRSSWGRSPSRRRTAFPVSIFPVFPS